MAAEERSFAQRFAASCRARRARVRALIQEGGVARAPEVVAEAVGLEVHSLAGEAALLQMEPVRRVASRLEGVFERAETRRGGPALDRALAWFDALTALVERGQQGIDPASGLALEDLAREIERSSDNGWLAPPDDAGAAQPEMRPRVLILDDSEIAREAMAEILEARGYPVATAGDLLEFEERLASFRPELILSDISMPDISGDEICRTLKTRFETENIPIVLVSGLPEEELARRARTAGADGWVSKQHGPDRLVDLLDDLLSQILF